MESILADYDEQKVRQVLADDAYAMGKKTGEEIGKKIGEEIGKKIGEDKLAKLLCRLYEDGKTDEAALVVKDEKMRKEYYCRYGIREEESE